MNVIPALPITINEDEWRRVCVQPNEYNNNLLITELCKELSGGAVLRVVQVNKGEPEQLQCVISDAEELKQRLYGLGRGVAV